MWFQISLLINACLSWDESCQRLYPAVCVPSSMVLRHTVTHTLICMRDFNYLTLLQCQSVT